MRPSPKGRASCSSPCRRIRAYALVAKEECAGMAAQLLSHYPMYANLGATDDSGNIVCSAKPFGGSINVRDFPEFTRVKESGRFSAGDVRVGPITGKPVLVFGYPIFDEKKKVSGMVFAALDTGVVGRQISRIPIHSDAVIRIVDRKGNIVASSKEHEKWTGRNVGDEPIIRTILSRGEGTAEVTGIDGVKRIYAFTSQFGGDRSSKNGAPQQAAPDLTVSPWSSGLEGLYFYAGLPVSEAYKEARGVLVLHLTILGPGHTLFAGCPAWFGTEAGILRQLNALMSATQRLAAGDLYVRTEIRGGTREVKILARDFDRMADSLQDKEGEREQV